MDFRPAASQTAASAVSPRPRVKMEPAQGCAPCSSRYQRGASLPTPCRQSGGSGRICADDLFLMRETRCTLRHGAMKSGGGCGLDAHGLPGKNRPLLSD